MNKPPRFAQDKISPRQTQQQAKQQHHARPPATGSVQPKIAAAQQKTRQPVAPPVYRPQPTAPQALQRKATVKQQPPAIQQARPAPVAPKAYRPQPVPKVLQGKRAGGSQPDGGKSPRQPVAPAVYRPEPKKIVQPKAAQPNRAQHVRTPMAPVQMKPMGRPVNAQAKPAAHKSAAPQPKPCRAVPSHKGQQASPSQPSRARQGAPSKIVQGSFLSDLWDTLVEFQWGLWPMGDPDDLFPQPPAVHAPAHVAPVHVAPVHVAPVHVAPVHVAPPPVPVVVPAPAPVLAAPVVIAPVHVPAPVPPVHAVHTISGEQAQNVQGRIQQLQQAVQQDRVALNNILAGANVVYRNLHGVALVALHNDLAQLEQRVGALVLRGNQLQGGITIEATYNTLRNDVRTRMRDQVLLRRRRTAQGANPLAPTLNIGVAAINNAGAAGLVNALNNWVGGGGGVIANTIFHLPAFQGHPNDYRWEIRNQALNAGPNSNNARVYGNGSIPTTAHGLPNVPAARNVLLAALAAAGYV